MSAPRAAGCFSIRSPRVMGMDRSKIRVLTPDVGGGFGTKAFFYPEYALAAVASQKARAAR